MEQDQTNTETLVHVCSGPNATLQNKTGSQKTYLAETELNRFPKDL